MDEEFVSAGTVRSVNPSRREVRVDAPERVLAGFVGRDWLFVEESPGDILRCRVVKVTLHNGVAIVRVASGVARDTVARLKGCRVVAPVAPIVERGVLDAAAEDCVGMTIVTGNDTLIGEVVAGFQTKANGVLEVLRPDGGSLLLPLVPEVVVSIDWHGKKVYVGDIAPFAVESDSGPHLT